jgi:TolB protein
MTSDNFPTAVPPSVGGVAPLSPRWRPRPWPALAQFRVEVSGVGLTQLPIALVPFRGERARRRRSAPSCAPIWSAAASSAPSSAAGQAMDETTRPDMSVWRQRAADALAGGSVTRLADGRHDVRFRLWDVVRGQDLGGQGYVVPQADLRLAAHKIADYIYEKLTGEKGVFSTRLAYVTKAGNRYTLWVADSDGENAQAALGSPEPIISPTWSPERHAAGLCVVRVAQAGHLRARRGHRAPAPAGQLPRLQQRAGLVARRAQPGGHAVARRRLAALPDQRQRRRAAAPDAVAEHRHRAAFSPDGASIYFVSDRGGAPQIYRMPVGGGAAQRVTFNGSYNVSPAVSPDGRYLAYVSRMAAATSCR